MVIIEMSLSNSRTVRIYTVSMPVVIALGNYGVDPTDVFSLPYWQFYVWNNQLIRTPIATALQLDNLTLHKAPRHASSSTPIPTFHDLISLPRGLPKSGKYQSRSWNEGYSGVFGLKRTHVGDFVHSIIKLQNRSYWLIGWLIILYTQNCQPD